MFHRPYVWKYELTQIRKKILLKQGEDKRNPGFLGNQYKSADLSTIDKTPHNTQKEIAEELGRNIKQKESGKEGRNIQLGGLSTIDKTPHDTRKEIADELGWSLKQKPPAI